VACMEWCAGDKIGEIGLISGEACQGWESLQKAFSGFQPARTWYQARSIPSKPLWDCIRYLRARVACLPPVGLRRSIVIIRRLDHVSKFRTRRQSIAPCRQPPPPRTLIYLKLHRYDDDLVRSSFSTLLRRSLIFHQKLYTHLRLNGGRGGYVWCPRLATPLQSPQSPLPLAFSLSYCCQDCIWLKDIFHLHHGFVRRCAAEDVAHCRRSRGREEDSRITRRPCRNQSRSEEILVSVSTFAGFPSSLTTCPRAPCVAHKETYT
jgi:hypothetical protein